MNVQQTLWYIIEKMYFNDYDFKDEFIEMIKTNSEYDGLYDILYLSICKKFNLQRNSHPTLVGVGTEEHCYSVPQKEIKTSNPYPLIQLVINNYSQYFFRLHCYGI